MLLFPWNQNPFIKDFLQIKENCKAEIKMGDTAGFKI